MSKSINPPEALGHAVNRREITDEMICRDVYPDFSGGGANEVDSSGLRFDRRSGHETREYWVISDDCIAFEAAESSREYLHSLLIRSKEDCDSEQILQLPEKDEDRPTTRRVGKREFSDSLWGLLLIVNDVEGNALPCG